MSLENTGNHSICPLNLPPGDIRLRHSARGTEIYDKLRHKWLLLTPEEWVRQHFTEYLHTHLAYPVSLMANEVSLILNGTSKRCDSVIYDRKGQPVMIVEYKAPYIAITQTVFDQIARYSLVLNVKYLIVSNGIKHFCCKFDHEERKYIFLKSIPAYEDL